MDVVCRVLCLDTAQVLRNIYVDLTTKRYILQTISSTLGLSPCSAAPRLAVCPAVRVVFHALHSAQAPDALVVSCEALTAPDGLKVG